MTQETEALFQDGVALQDMGRLTDALACYDAALALRPAFAKAQLARAHVLWALGRRSEAFAATEAAIAIRPGFAAAHFNRGFMLQQERRLQSALDCYGRAVLCKPDLVEAWNNRAGILQSMGRYPEALDDLDRALALAPGSGAAHYNRGSILLELERFEEAQESFSHALTLVPDHPDAFGCLTMAAIGACDWPKVAARMPRLLTEVAAGASVVPPVVFLGQSDDLALQRACAQTNLKALLSASPNVGNTPCTAKAYDPERLRLAYMSSNFGIHPVASHIVNLLERHDRTKFEVLGISLGLDDGSNLRARIVKACDVFHDVAAKSDDDIAALLRGLEVDIIIDLNGQTLGWRPGILAQRPAPVQVSFLGYAGTSGAEFIDYIIADAEAVPAGCAVHYSEKIVQLPHSFWPSDPTRALAPTPSRAASGLPDNGLVFCVFNNHHKITAPMFACWMRLLAAVPESVLWLRRAPETVAGNLRREAAAHGVDPGRLIFAPLVAPEIHLARHRLADLFLDTFPYNAHSSASDALWMGLPLMTLRGQGFAARVASSLLHALNLAELVTDSLTDYEALALALARDPVRLQDVRDKLAANLPVAPLFDIRRYCGNLETAYRKMSEIARAGEAPRNFSI